MRSTRSSSARAAVASSLRVSSSRSPALAASTSLADRIAASGVEGVVPPFALPLDGVTALGQGGQGAQRAHRVGGERRLEEARGELRDQRGGSRGARHRRSRREPAQARRAARRPRSAAARTTRAGAPRRPTRPRQPTSRRTATPAATAAGTSRAMVRWPTSPAASASWPASTPTTARPMSHTSSCSGPQGRVDHRAVEGPRRHDAAGEQDRSEHQRAHGRHRLTHGAAQPRHHRHQHRGGQQPRTDPSGRRPAADAPRDEQRDAGTERHRRPQRQRERPQLLGVERCGVLHGRRQQKRQCEGGGAAREQPLRYLHRPCDGSSVVTAVPRPRVGRLRSHAVPPLPIREWHSPTVCGCSYRNWLDLEESAPVTGSRPTLRGESAPARRRP